MPFSSFFKSKKTKESKSTSNLLNDDKHLNEESKETQLNDSDDDYDDNICKFSKKVAVTIFSIFHPKIKTSIFCVISFRLILEVVV